jgi:hypothetical protein
MAVGVALAAAGCGSRDGLARRPPPPYRPQADGFRHTPVRPADRAARGRAAVTLPAAQPGWEPAVTPRQWQWIVIHHSATATGSAATFDSWHRNHNHWDELGYHFVIGNGTASGDGQVEIGPRWLKQKHGAHCRVGDDETYNQTGIGICLVGDFQKARPTEAEMQALAALVDWLSLRFAIPDSHIIGHGTVDVTTCPGRYFPMAGLRRRIAARRRARLAVSGARP